MKFCENYKQMVENIIQLTSEYMTIHHMKSMIIGLSGGIDSTFCAALAYEAKKRIKHDISLIGITIPIETSIDETKRAQVTGEAFCDHFRIEGMQEIYWALRDELVCTSPYRKIREGNIKARLRMIKLFDAAKENDGLVLSTDNWTEYLLGFWTLHGDVGNFGMIQELWKTEVYGLAYYLCTQYTVAGELKKSEALFEGINAIPTDGLGITDSDFDQIMPGYDKSLDSREVYRKIDRLLMNHNPVLPVNDVTRRYVETSFKRNDPYNIKREDIIGKD